MSDAFDGRIARCWQMLLGLGYEDHTYRHIVIFQPPYAGAQKMKLVHSIQDRGINQIRRYQHALSRFTLLEKTVPREGIYEEIRRRGLKVAVAGIPKTIGNDIPVIDKSFGFDTAFEEAQRAINAAH
ncbi:hypothetical protein C3L33_10377, partial [Rhododendron williamsianum]